MISLLQSSVILTIVAASAAVAIAGSDPKANVLGEFSEKEDRLPMVAGDGPEYLTIEKREPGMSTLIRVPLAGLDCAFKTQRKPSPACGRVSSTSNAKAR
jgi:hypothetical protein